MKINGGSTMTQTRDRNQTSYSKLKILRVIIPAQIIILILIPLCVYSVSKYTHNWLRLSNISLIPYNYLIGGAFILGGYSFIMWSVVSFLKIGKGTPLQTTPTQKLVINGPFKYTRNPMFLGMTVYLAGLGIVFSCWIWTFGFIPFFLLMGSLFLKLYEEKELEERFGHDYTEYKKNTPFLLPKIKRD
ncbi:MAG TPA: isoprenylcysteine carboxylmethyltransferase family protein [Candidatus Atribacteria bacterium]|nr:isoprenylcysteine carboxylmethyltransferase family protein [Candidatus Atribacteria bacterium]